MKPCTMRARSRNSFSDSFGAMNRSTDAISIAISPPRCSYSRLCRRTLGRSRKPSRCDGSEPLQNEYDENNDGGRHRRLVGNHVNNPGEKKESQRYGKPERTVVKKNLLIRSRLSRRMRQSLQCKELNTGPGGRVHLRPPSAITAGPRPPTT